MSGTARWGGCCCRVWGIDADPRARPAGQARESLAGPGLLC
jgi:hypothetical protein